MLVFVETSAAKLCQVRLLKRLKLRHCIYGSLSVHCIPIVKIACLFAQELLQDSLLLPSVAQREGILDGFLGTPAPGLGVQHSAIIASYQVITLLVHLWIPRHVPVQQYSRAFPISKAQHMYTFSAHSAQRLGYPHDSQITP